MTVEDAIYDRLMNGDILMSLVKREIYKGFRSQGQNLPCVTFLRVSTVPVNGATGSSGTEHILIQVDCWASRSSSARKIAEAVKARLDGWSRTSDPAIAAMVMNDEQDIQEPPDAGGGLAEYRVTQTWSIWQQA